jgi:integrase
MPSGSVIAYDGARGRTWRIKFRDATGKQVMETIGAEHAGITRKSAEAALRDRVVKVEQKGYRKPAPLTFKTYTTRWFEQAEQRRGWKPKTAQTHRHRLVHLIDYFGNARLGKIHPGDITAYIGQALDQRSARTGIAEVNLLHDVLGHAVVEELIQANPVTGVERPKAKPSRWRILEPDEVRRVASAFTDERARTVFLTLHLTGLRRHEAQSLLWRDVSLTEATLRVVESKSEEGERLIAIPPTLVDVLERRYQASP